MKKSEKNKQNLNPDAPTMPLFGDLDQQTTTVAFLKENLATYPDKAGTYAALNGRVILPITGQITTIDKEIVILNVGSSTCQHCIDSKASKPPHDVIADIIANTAFSIMEGKGSKDTINDLLRGIIDGIHQMLHYMGIKDRDQALSIAQAITQRLNKEISDCWHEQKKAELTN